MLWIKKAGLGQLRASVGDEIHFEVNDTSREITGLPAGGTATHTVSREHAVAAHPEPLLALQPRLSVWVTPAESVAAITPNPEPRPAQTSGSDDCGDGGGSGQAMR